MVEVFLQLKGAFRVLEEGEVGVGVSLLLLVAPLLSVVEGDLAVMEEDLKKR